MVRKPYHYDMRRFPRDEEIDGLLVGPDSITWRYASDMRLNFVMLYPLLLQVAHPTVGAAVRDYSDFDRRPWDRLARTTDYLTLLIYGGRDAAPAGRRLRALHGRFMGVRADGERYYALEPRAYAWVHATLLESYVAGHRMFGRPMNRAQVERFYDEYRGLGRLIGVGPGDLPDDWAAFRDYFDGVVATELRQTESVDRLLRAVHNPASPSLPLPLADLAWLLLRIPARRAAWLGGVGLVAPALRSRLEIRWSWRDEAEFQLAGAAARAMTPVLPAAFRVTGPAQLRRRREAIARGPLGAGTAPLGAGTAPLGAGTAPRRDGTVPPAIARRAEAPGSGTRWPRGGPTRAARVAPSRPR
jgi:uncharacterized protein (DUF2236 family)